MRRLLATSLRFKDIRQSLPRYVLRYVQPTNENNLCIINKFKFRSREFKISENLKIIISDGVQYLIYDFYLIILNMSIKYSRAFVNNHIWQFLNRVTYFLSYFLWFYGKNRRLMYRTFEAKILKRVYFKVHNLNLRIL